MPISNFVFGMFLNSFKFFFSFFCQFPKNNFYFFFDNSNNRGDVSIGEVGGLFKLKD